jgi:hypothetical protein
MCSCTYFYNPVSNMDIFTAVRTSNLIRLNLILSTVGLADRSTAHGHRSKLSLYICVASKGLGCKVKIGKAVTLRQAPRRQEVQLVLVLDLGTRWSQWSASRLSRALPPGKGSLVTIGQEAGWALELVWTHHITS